MKNPGLFGRVSVVVVACASAWACAPGVAGAESAEAASTPGASPTTAECRAKLAADYGPLGKGSDVVRRLYPQFDPTTFLVKAEPAYALLDCDFLLRRSPGLALALVLKFPSTARVGKQGTSDSESIFDDVFRFEIADLRGDSLEHVSVARNPDALTSKTIDGTTDNTPLPIGHARLDRTSFSLNESESAVAVRFDVETTADGYGAYLSEYDELALFRPDGPSLALILLAPLKVVTTQVHCEDDPKCGGSDQDKYVVRISRQHTGGLFDLIVKNVSHPRKEPAVRYQWNGKAYVAAPEKKK